MAPGDSVATFRPIWGKTVMDHFFDHVVPKPWGGKKDPVLFRKNWYYSADLVSLLIIAFFIFFVGTPVSFGLALYISIGAIGIYLEKANYRRQKIRAFIMQRANQQWSEEIMSLENEFGEQTESGEDGGPITTVSCAPVRR